MSCYKYEAKAAEMLPNIEYYLTCLFVLYPKLHKILVTFHTLIRNANPWSIKQPFLYTYTYYMYDLYVVINENIHNQFISVFNIIIYNIYTYCGYSSWVFVHAMSLKLLGSCVSYSFSSYMTLDPHIVPASSKPTHRQQIDIRYLHLITKY
mgnify:CR=1 FL=1